MIHSNINNLNSRLNPFSKSKGMCMQEETVMETTKKGPGEKLKHARESFGLTIWDIANQLYLPHHVLNALEEDDYHAHLPARAFIRGYLRSYAKLLNLSPEEILNDFDALGVYKTPQEESTKSLSQPRKSLTIHKDKFWFSVVGGGLLGILLLIAGLTWMNTRQEKNEDLVNQALHEDEKLSEPEMSVAEPPKAETTAMAVIESELPLNEAIESTPSKAPQKVETPIAEIASSQTALSPLNSVDESVDKIKTAESVISEASVTSASETMLTPVDAPMPMAQL